MNGILENHRREFCMIRLGRSHFIEYFRTYSSLLFFYLQKYKLKISFNFVAYLFM